MDQPLVALALEGSDDRIVLWPWDERSGRFENLERVAPGGAVRWRAALPANSGVDCFVAVRFDGDLLCANTWSCFAVWIAPSGGETVRTAFTK